MMTEKQLTDALRRKDEAAFRELILRFQPITARVIFKITGDKEETLDLVQEVFVSIWEQVKNFREEASLSTWIYQLSTNKARNHLKWKKLRTGFRLSWQSEQAQPPAGMNHSLNMALEMFERKDDENAITMALQQLPHNQRTAFVLSKSEGLSNPEIAAIMKLSVSSVESLNFRARQNLVKILLPYYNNKKS